MEPYLRQFNSGLLIQSPRPSDWLFGAENQIKIVLPSKKWNPFLPDFERQHSIYFDTMACVSFSRLNKVETLFNYSLANNLFPDSGKNFLSENGYIVNGKVNFSDRYTAKKSGTTRQGNYLWNVAESTRRDGLVPEASWQYPRDQRQPAFNWNDYYAPIPSSVEGIAAEFKKHFLINYYWVYEKDFNDALAYSPLQVTGFAWALNEFGEFYSPLGSRPNHAFLKYSLENKIFDHYDPAIKNLSSNYIFDNVAMAASITCFNNEIPMKLIKSQGSSTVYLIDADGNRSAFYDEQHFNSVAPRLGLAKKKSENNDITDWTQVKLVSDVELNSYPLKRPFVVIE